MDAVEFAKLSRLQRLAEELAPTDHDLLKSMRNLEDNDAWCRFYWPPALRDLSASRYKASAGAGSQPTAPGQSAYRLPRAHRVARKLKREIQRPEEQRA